MEFNKEEILEYLKSNTIYIDNCWLYQMHLNNGYGNIKINNVTYKVHRLSAYFFLSLDLDNFNLQANHKDECKNKNCWNPDHLYVGTQYQNIQDITRLKKFKNQTKTHCPKGHLIDGVTTRLGSKHSRRYCRVCSRINRTKYLKNKRNNK